MALIVEDGSGLVLANALISLEYFKTYCDARGFTYSDDDDLNEQAVIRASDFVSNGFQWQGFRKRERGHAEGMQAQAWPRTHVVDRHGYSVDKDSVPDEIARATAEIARTELATPGAMAPVYQPQERRRSVKIGPIAVDYDLSRVDAESARPVLLAVRDLVGEFLARGTGGRLSGDAARG